MPDKHIGHDRVYEAIQVQIFRKPWLSDASKFRWQATLGPYYIKDRSEIPGIFKSIAKANKTQGMFDWGFKWKSLGAVRRRTVEDVNWQEKKNGRN